MNKRLAILLSLSLILALFCWGKPFYDKHKTDWRISRIKIQPANAEALHIYTEPATTSAMLQMLDLIRQDEQSPKLVFWPRYHSDDLQKELKKYNAFSVEEEDFLPVLSKFLNTLTDAKLFVHYNTYHDKFLKQIIATAGQERIKKLYLYEDAPAWIWWDPVKDNDIAALSLPAEFFFKYQNRLKDDSCSKNARCEQLRKILKNIKTNNVDFYQMAQEITEDEKEKLSRLLGINLKKLKKTLQNPYFLYTLGFSFEDLHHFSQLFPLQQTCENWQNKGNIFYKQHPYHKNMPSGEVLQTLCPNIKELPLGKAPFELLILLDLAPKEIAGYSSSLFYTLSKEKVKLFIPREKDPYIPSLTDLGILDKAKISHITLPTELTIQGWFFYPKPQLKCDLNRCTVVR